jgi:hypothetical protein
MSANSELIKEWFLQSLTARAAYAYFTGMQPTAGPVRETGHRETDINSVLQTLTERIPNVETRFSEELANYFVAHFATIDHLPNTSSGYSATLFARRSEPIPFIGTALSTTNPSPQQQQYSQFVFAQRGTEPTSPDTALSDLIIADGGIALFGSPSYQRADMNESTS